MLDFKGANLPAFIKRKDGFIYEVKKLDPYNDLGLTLGENIKEELKNPLYYRVEYHYDSVRVAKSLFLPKSLGSKSMFRMIIIVLQQQE